MGIVIAAGFLVSAAIDLAVGAGLARHMASAASASRIQFFGSVFCAASLVAVFLGAWMPSDLRFGYALTAGIIFRLSFATYDIPQNALMALATIDARERLRIASVRIWFSGAATLIVAVTIGPLVARRGQADTVPFFLGLATLFGIAAIGSAAVLAHFLRNRRATQTAETGAAAPPGRFLADFWLLLLVMVATSAFTPAFGKLEPYFASYALRSAWWGGAVIILMAAGIIAGQPIWMRLSNRMPGGVLMLLNALLQIAALAIFWWFGPVCPSMAAASAFAFGLGNGGVGMVQWAAFSETVARLGQGRVGFSYGLFAATSKIALAAGGILLSVALARTDLHDANSIGLTSLMAAIPGLGALGCALAGVGLFLTERQRKPVFVAAGPDLGISTKLSH